MSYILDGRHRRSGTLEVKTARVRVRGQTRLLRIDTVEYQRVRSFGATFEYRHGGRKLEQGSSLWDFYGYGTCIEEAVRQAGKAATFYGIDASSSLVVVVRLKETVAFVRPLPNSYKGRTYEAKPDGPKSRVLASFVVWDNRLGWRVPSELLRRYCEAHQERRQDAR